MFCLSSQIRSAAFAALLFFALTGCEPATPPEVRLSGLTMGTEYHVKVIARLEEHGQDALNELIAGVLDKVNTLMSTYQDDSELSRFNQAPAGKAFPLSPETAAVFECALAISGETDGAFDVTVGPLVNAWGFGPEGDTTAPTDAELAALLARTGYQHLSLQNGALTKAREGIYCDLSAVAKGYAVDQVAELLEARGYSRYMVEVGGEVRAAGLNQHDLPWRIAIEKPVAETREIQRVVALQGASMATSGDYRNFITVDGQRRSHTIDPATGKSITHGLASVSVIHAQCMWADGYATALNVFGPERAKAFATEHKLAVFLLTHSDGGGFEEWASPQFEPYLHGTVTPGKK